MFNNKLKKISFLLSATMIFSSITFLFPMIANASTYYTNDEKEALLYYKYKQQQNEANLIKQRQTAYNNGINSFSNKNWSNAINYLSQVENYYGNQKNFNIAMGESYRQLNNLNKAVYYLGRAYQLGATDYTTLTGLGYAYMDLNNYNSAYQYLLKASQAYANQPDPFWNLGLTCDKLNNTDVELSSFIKLININPQYGSDPYIYIGKIYTNQKNLNAALNYYLKGINYFKENPVLYFLAGDTYFNAGNYTKAIDYFTSALNYQNNYIDAYYERGFSYIYLDDLDDASTDCNTLSKISPKNSATTDLCKAVSQKLMEKQMQQQIQQQIIQDQIDQQTQESQQQAEQSTGMS